jgi:sec-independent protein translocase protein TatA
MFRNPLIDAAVVLIVVLLFFGPKRLPQLGRSLGEGMREFKDSITRHHDDEDPSEIAPSQPVATGAPPAESASTAPPESQSAGVASSEQRS